MTGRLIFKAVSDGIRMEADLREMTIVDMIMLSNSLINCANKLMLESLRKMGKEIKNNEEENRIIDPNAQ